MAAAYGGIHRAAHGDAERILVRIVTTCTEMLRDRGCTDVEAPADWRLEADPPQPAVHGTTPAGRRTAVYLYPEERVSVKWLRQVLEAEAGGTALVVVSPDGPTPFARKECDVQGHPVQFLSAREVCVNVTKHHLVPRHAIVAAPPPGVEPHHLPKLPESDPVARYYHWPVGTIVRVERRFGGHEATPYFRIVVA